MKKYNYTPLSLGCVVITIIYTMCSSALAPSSSDTHPYSSLNNTGFFLLLPAVIPRVLIIRYKGLVLEKTIFLKSQIGLSSSGIWLVIGLIGIL